MGIEFGDRAIGRERFDITVQIVFVTNVATTAIAGKLAQYVGISHSEPVGYLDLGWLALEEVGKI